MKRALIAATLALASGASCASCALVAGLGSDKELNNSAIAEDDAAVGMNDAGPKVDADAPASIFQGDGEIVASQQDHPKGIGVDRTYVVWANQGTGVDGAIVRFVKDTKTVTAIVTKQATPEQLLVDNGAAYWNALDKPVVNDGSGRPLKVTVLGRVALADASFTLLDEDDKSSKQRRMALFPTTPGAIEDGFLFVAYSDHVRRFARGATTPDKDVAGKISTGSQPVTAIAADPTYVYWFGAGVVARRGKALDQTQSVEILGSIPGAVTDMTVTGNNLWATTSTGDVYTLPTATLNGVALKVGTTLAAPHTIVVQADTAFVLRGTSGATDGQVVALALGKQKILADHMPEPRELALDQSVLPAMLYWTCADGTIRRVAASVP